MTKQSQKKKSKCPHCEKDTAILYGEIDGKEYWGCTHCGWQWEEQAAKPKGEKA